MSQSLGMPGAAHTVRTLVDDVAATLERAGIADARAEARDLVAAVAEQPRFWPRLHADARVDADVAGAVRAAAARRALGAPFAYAVGCAAFRFLTLTVDERVLVPRQETEVLVDLVLRARSHSRHQVVADIGTGSGAIALALASEATFERVIATDVSADALAVARANETRLRPRLRSPVFWRLGAGLAPIASERVDVLVCNPPYIAFDEACDLPSSVRDWEPAPALLCGQSGLAVTRDVIRGAPQHLRRDGLLALEVDVRRAATVVEMLASNEHYRAVTMHLDLSGRERFVLATRA